VIALVVAVPLVIHPRSQNLADVKDVTLGLGAAAGLGLWLVAGLAQGRLSWVRSRLNALVLAFAAWAAITIIYAQFRYVAVSEFGRLAANVGLYLLAITCLRTSKQVTRVIIAACLGSIPVSIYAFAQAMGKDFITYKVQGDVGRVFSFFGNATYFGGYLILLIPVAIALAWPKNREGQEANGAGPSRPPGRTGRGGPFDSAQGRPSGSPRGRSGVSAFTALAALLMLVSLYLSYTISGVIGLGLGVTVAASLAMLRGGRKALRVGVPAFLMGAVVLGALGLLAYRYMPKKQQRRVEKVVHFQDPYARERQLHWRTAFQLFKEKPVLGNGYGTFRAVALGRMATEWYMQQPKRRQGMLALGYAHNEYLQSLADSGLVGGVLFVAMLLAGLGLAIKVFWRAEDPTWRHLGLAVAVAFIAFYFQNFFGVTFRQTGAVTFFWLWLAMLAVAGAGLAKGGSESGAPSVGELRFRRLSLAGVAVAALAVAAALVVLAWMVITPVRASALVRASEKAALNAKDALGAGQMQTAAQWFAASAAIARKAVEMCPYSATGYYQLAFAEAQLGQFEPTPEAKQAQLEKAVAANRRALALMPGSGPMYYSLGVTYKLLGKLAEAEVAFREAVRLTPTIFEHQAGMAEVLLAEGKLKEAESYARKVAHMARRNPKVYILLRDIHRAQGDFDAMLRDVKAAARVAPKDPALQGQVAEVLLERKQYREALDACQKWVSLAPESAAAYGALGFAQYKLGQVEAARASLEKALSLDANERQARLCLARVLLALNRPEAAVQHLTYLAVNYPDTPEGRAARAAIERARQRTAADRQRGLLAPGVRGAARHG